MTVSSPLTRTAIRPRSPSFEELYESRRPAHVSIDDWLAIFDGLFSEITRSLAPPRNERAA